MAPFGMTRGAYDMHYEQNYHINFILPNASRVMPNGAQLQMWYMRKLNAKNSLMIPFPTDIMHGYVVDAHWSQLLNS